MARGDGNPSNCMVIIHAEVRMGPPPRSLAAEAIGCFMVRSLRVTNRIQGCGATSRAPWRAPLGSSTLPRAHARDGVAGTLRTKSPPSANEGRLRTIGSPTSPEEPRSVWDGEAGTIGLQTPVAAFTPNVEEPKNALDSKRPHTSSYETPHGGAYLERPAQQPRTLDPRASADFILAQPKLRFATYIRGVTSEAVSIPVDARRLDRQEMMSEDAYAAFPRDNRTRVPLNMPPAAERIGTESNRFRQNFYR